MTDDAILVQINLNPMTLSSGEKVNRNGYFSNIVGMTTKSLYVNPITGESGKILTKELYDYVCTIPSLVQQELREDKLKEILS